MKIFFQEYYTMDMGRSIYGVLDTVTSEISYTHLRPKSLGSYSTPGFYSRELPVRPEVITQSWSEHQKITNVLEGWLPFLYTNGIRDKDHDPAYWSDAQLKNAVELKTNLWSAYNEYKS